MEGNGERKWKLNYKIVGRRSLFVSGAAQDPGRNGPSGPDHDMDMIDVEWRHEDGFKPDTREKPFIYAQVDEILSVVLGQAVKQNILTDAQVAAVKACSRQIITPHPMRGEIGILTMLDGVRDMVGDQINVPKGTPLSICAMMLEEKRSKLAQALGVEP